MADIDASLKRAIDGPAPQHKVEGEQAFEFTEGKDGKLNVRDSELLSELELIKAQQTQILERLDGDFNTQLTGSMVAYLNITNEVGLISAGTEFRYTIPSDYEGNYKYVSVWFRRTAGTIEEINLQHWSEVEDRLAGATQEKMEYLTTPASINVTKKTEVLSRRTSLLLKAGEETDFKPRLITVTLWN